MEKTAARTFLLKILQVGGREVIFDVVPGQVGVDHGVDPGNGALLFGRVAGDSILGVKLLFVHSNHLADRVSRGTKTILMKKENADCTVLVQSA